MVGRTLGHYRVLEKLGEGGMGEVYLAEDTKLERKVALKVLPSEMAENPERLERFEREAKAVAALNHPNIVHVHSVEEVDGLHFFTMELVEGESLGQLIPSEGLPLKQFFSLAIPLADALAEAHEQGIVHRDLKPPNVMVDRKGRPKILDFGLAKLRQAEQSAEFSELPTEVMTEEGKVLGTYPYMSPEQVEGKSVDHRSDMFSLGTMLYEMATGRRPFQGDSPASLMSAILTRTPSEVDMERPDLPHHLGRIIGRCLEKNVEDRYQRAKNLKNDLDKLRREVESGSAVTIDRPGPASEKRSIPKLALTGVLVVVIAVVLLLVIRPWDGGSNTEPEASQQIKSLAVLPLENLSGDPEQEYFVDGMTDALIADLSRIGALRVISRQSVMRYKGSDKSVPEIARELDVDALIEGSVMSAGDRVRITAQLVQANPEAHLWAEAYERETRDALTLLSEVTRAIVDEVQVTLTPTEQVRLEETRGVHPDALKAYLMGIQLSRQVVSEDVMKSAYYFQEAVRLDPAFAEAWASLANYYQDLEHWVLPHNARAERASAITAGDEALMKALELDESLSLNHRVRAMTAFWRDWDWSRADVEFRKAIDLDPNDSLARVAHGLYLSAMGRCDKALEEAEFAERLDPQSHYVLFNKGHLLYYCHQFEMALAQYEKLLALFPGDVFTLSLQGEVLVALDRPAEAVEKWQQLRIWSGQPEMAARFEGKTMEEVNRIAMELYGDPQSPMYSPMIAANAYAQNRESDQVFKYLEQAFEARAQPGGTAGWMITFLKVDPDYLYLHDDPRFQDILRRIGLAD